MRNRVLLSAGAIALVAASCAQPEPQVLSEAPRSASTAEVTSPAATTDRDEQPGRFIARCATEADGGTPGMTFFTDGTQNVTDHCLSRYYIGLQPSPGALYVPDEEAGSYAPSRETSPVETTGQQWTPAQPRTDTGLTDGAEEDPDPLDDEPTTEQPDDPDNDAPDTDDPGTEDPDAPATPVTPVTPTDGTSPTTPPTSNPGDTEPGSTEPTTTGAAEAGGTGEPAPTAPGSSEPTAVPTVGEAPLVQQQSAPPTSVASGTLGPDGSGASDGGQSSVRLPGFRWLGSFWPGGPRS